MYLKFRIVFRLYLTHCLLFYYSRFIVTKNDTSEGGLLKVNNLEFRFSGTHSFHTLFARFICILRSRCTLNINKIYGFYDVFNSSRLLLGLNKVGRRSVGFRGGHQTMMVNQRLLENIPHTSNVMFLMY